MLNACGKKHDDSDSPAASAAATPANLPLITPPVKAATPAGFLTGSSLQLDGSGISTTDLKSRFFSPGPTSLLRILGDIDSFISSVNTQSKAQSITCLSQTPVAYSVKVNGEDHTFYGQCYSVGTATAKDPQLRQFGVKDGTIYLYSAYGAERVAAMVKPIANTTDKHQVQAWIGVGYTNATTFDSGSYGVFSVVSDSNTNAFEMAVGGIGMGFCGAQLKSDGTNLYATGSTDMGSTCDAVSELCVKASDLTTAGTCDTVKTFGSLPIGRLAAKGANTSAASTYPTTPNVTLDGTTTDSLWFGPTTPTTGVGNFADVAATNTGTGTGTDTSTKTK